MKKGYFKTKGYGLFKRTRSDWRFAKGSKRKGFSDVMGTWSKTKKDTASSNAFIRGMGL